VTVSLPYDEAKRLWSALVHSWACVLRGAAEATPDFTIVKDESKWPQIMDLNVKLQLVV
jgi:hypothetical protein